MEEKKILTEDVKLAGIHTLQTDAAETIKKENVSVIQIAAAGQNKLHVPTIASKDDSGIKHIFTRRATFALIVLILGGALFFYIFTSKPKSAPVPTIKNTELISYDASSQIFFTANDLTPPSAFTAKIASQANSNNAGITLYKIYQKNDLITSEITIDNFFQKMSPTIPDSLFRTIEPKGFIGSVNSKRFMIYKVGSFEIAYGGMLNWEPTLKNDLLPFFASTSAIPVGTTINFEDKIVANKDARILRNTKNNGNYFVYGFYDPTTIVIAEDEDTLKNVYDSLLRNNL